MDTFLAQALAKFIERSYGNYKTTIAGLCSATVTAVGAYAPFVPAKYHGLVIAVGAFLGLLAAALGKDK
jgi:hypothetical protein